MKATEVTAPGEVAVVDCPEPEMRDDHIRITPIAATLSGRNVRQVYDGRADAYPLEKGASAHEIVGKVEETAYPSGQWREAKLSELVTAYLANPTGLAETLVVPQAQVYWLPPAENPDLHLVPAARQLGQIIEACNTFPSVATGAVAVVGQGAAGLLFVQLLARLGASTIVVVDPIAARREAGTRYGATLALDSGRPASELAGEVRCANAGALVEVVVDTVGSPESLVIATELVESEGLLHLFGDARSAVMPFDIGSITTRNYTVRASGAGIGAVDSFWSPYGNAMNLVLRGEVGIASLITHRFALADAGRAFALANSGDDGVLKVGIDY